VVFYRALSQMNDVTLAKTPAATPHAQVSSTPIIPPRSSKPAHPHTVCKATYSGAREVHEQKGKTSKGGRGEEGGDRKPLGAVNKPIKQMAM
jgi:hypothetical protein